MMRLENILDMPRQTNRYDSNCVRLNKHKHARLENILDMPRQTNRYDSNCVRLNKHEHITYRHTLKFLKCRDKPVEPTLAASTFHYAQLPDRGPKAHKFCNIP